MDTKIVQKKNSKKYLLIGIPVVLLLGYFVYTSLTKKRSLTVKRSEISIKKVENIYFEDFIVFQAKVAPLNAMLLTITEGGSVKEIYVENGDSVKKGQLLVKLYNPNTELNYMQQETAIVEQINNLNKAKLDLRNQELNLAKDLIAIQHDYAKAKQEYNLNKKLYDKEIIARNEWETTTENYRFQQERMSIIKESVQKEKQANQLQIKQMNQALHSMQKSLQVLRTNKQNFLVKAPITGRLSSFEPLLGKNYQQGEVIGKIDKMDGYKLIADVDEYYLQRINEGQKGTINYKNTKINVQISKVIPEVKNGRFQVELHFKTPNKLDLKQGFSFAVRLNLSEKTQSVVIPKGSFYSDTAGKWIFIVKNKKAERRNIKLGKENPLYYEVLEGLKVGDEVITSTYQDYKHIEEIKIE